MPLLAVCETLLLTFDKSWKKFAKAWPSLSNKPSQSVPSPLLPKSLNLVQPCRQVDHCPLPRAASCRPTARDELRELSSVPSRPAEAGDPIGCEPGSQHM